MEDMKTLHENITAELSRQKEESRSQMKAIADLMKEMQKSIDEKTTTEKKEDGVSEGFP